MLRVPLPKEVATITPGYSYRLDLDMKFDGERPDWANWMVRMHLWGNNMEPFTVVASVELIEDLEGSVTSYSIPVLRVTKQQTLQLKNADTIFYLIDVTSPDGDIEDYYSGTMVKLPSPPVELIA